MTVTPGSTPPAKPAAPASASAAASMTTPAAEPAQATTPRSDVRNHNSRLPTSAVMKIPGIRPATIDTYVRLTGKKTGASARTDAETKDHEADDEADDGAWPTLPKLVRRLAGLERAALLDAPAIQRAYEALGEELQPPDGNEPMVIAAPTGHFLMAPHGEPGFTLLAPHPAAPVDAGEPDITKYFVDATSLFPTMATRYGLPDLAGRTHRTVLSLAAATHWVEALARALVAADEGARRARSTDTPAILESQLVEAVRAAKKHHANLSGLNGEINRLEQDAQVAGRRIKGFHARVQKLEHEVRVLHEHLQAWERREAGLLGTVDDVADFLLGHFDSRTCDPPTRV